MLYVLAAALFFLAVADADGKRRWRYVRKHRRPRRAGKRITLWDLNVGQLIAHDAFRVARGDRKSLEGTQNQENGYFDMSTVLRDVTKDGHPVFECAQIRKGGDFRQQENFMLATVAEQLGNYYCDLIEKDHYSVERAYDKAMEMYRGWIRELYFNLMGEHMEKGWDGDCDWKYEEDLAWRAVHVMAPGQVNLDGKWEETMRVPRHKGSEKWLHEHWSKRIDGHFAPELTRIPFGNRTFNLLAADHSYGVQFRTKEPFQLYLDELDRYGRFAPGLKVTKRVKDFFHRGYYCPMRKEYKQPPYPKKPYVPKYDHTVSLWDLGVLQLAAHDAANVARGNRVDLKDAKQLENGWFDLTTLLKDSRNGMKPFDCEAISKGGEFRNSENVFLRSVAIKLGRMYCEDIYVHRQPWKKSYFKILALYHKWIKESYANMMKGAPKKYQWPKQYNDDDCYPLPEENLAFRTVHQMLPGEVEYYGHPGKYIKTMAIRDPVWPEKWLREHYGKPMDGKFAPEFLEIRFGPNAPPFNLKLADATFGKQFGVPMSYEDMLKEGEKYGHYVDGYVSDNIHRLIQKGMYCHKRVHKWFNKPYRMHRAELYYPKDYKGDGKDLKDDDYEPAWKPDYKH